MRARTPFCSRISRLTSFEILLDAIALRVELVVAIGLEEQREQAIELFLQLGLIRGGGREAFVLQQLDDRFEPDVDILLAALGDGVAKQLRAARVGGCRQLGQPADDFFQPLVAIGEAGLLDGELVGRGGRFGLSRRALVFLAESSGPSFAAAYRQAARMRSVTRKRQGRKVRRKRAVRRIDCWHIREITIISFSLRLCAFA